MVFEGFAQTFKHLGDEVVDAVDLEGRSAHLPVHAGRVRRRGIRWFRLSDLLDSAAATDMLALEHHESPHGVRSTTRSDT